MIFKTLRIEKLEADLAEAKAEAGKWQMKAETMESAFDNRELVIEAIRKECDEAKAEVERLMKTGLTFFRELGVEINEINRANGWHVCTPSDWSEGAVIEDWIIDKPFWRVSENCQGQTWGHFIAWGQHKATKQCHLGTGATEAEAVEALLVNIGKDTAHYKIPGVVALIHSEASEALEAFRHRDKTNFEEELADVLIRVLDCASGLGLDLDTAVRAKLEKNKTRGYRHGGKTL